MGARWLLDLELMGRTLRVATEPVTVDTIGGLSYTYAAGLGQLQTSIAPDSVPIVVDRVLEASWARLHAEGHLLEGAAATLRLHHDGDTMESARVVAAGVLEGVSYGDDSEPMQASIVVSELRLGATVPPPWAVADRSTWPTDRNFGNYELIDGVVGSYYPVVIGYPGFPGVSCVPVWLCEADLDGSASGGERWLVAEGRIGATQLRIVNLEPTPAESDTYTVGTMVDKQGHLISYLEADPTVSATEAGKYYVDHSLSTGGGIVGPSGDVLRGAGDVIEYMLRRYGRISYDAAKMAEVRATLNAYYIDTWINEPVPVWEWIESALLELLPVIVSRSRRGLYLRHMDWEATDDAVRMRLDGQGRVRRSSAVQYRSAPLNEHVLEYGLARGSYYLRRALSATDGVLQQTPESVIYDSRVLGDYRSAISQQAYGVRAAEVLQTAAVWDTSTALRILRDRSAELSWPHRTVEYVGDSRHLRHLDLGDVVALTDDELHASDQLALVEDMTVSVSEVAVSLTLLEHPPSQSRPTA